jgi:hypothetical protein
VPHNYNRNAFQAGATSGSLLLNVYSSLVVLELAIKDHLNPRPSGHKVASWIANNFGEAALSAQLRHRLGALYCTDRDGREANINADGYPDLRYLRHESDFAAKSTNVQLEAALEIIRDIAASLRSKGVAI